MKHLIPLINNMLGVYDVPEVKEKIIMKMTRLDNDLNAIDREMLNDDLTHEDYTKLCKIAERKQEFYSCLESALLGVDPYMPY